MSQEKVIIEVSGGLVQAVTAGNFVEVVIIDHDDASVRPLAVSSEATLSPEDYKGYDGGFPDGWPQRTARALQSVYDQYVTDSKRPD